MLGACVAALTLAFLLHRTFHAPNSPPNSGLAELVSVRGISKTEQARELASYAGSESCRECHQEEYALWRKSNHALAERRLDPADDRAAFAPPRSFHHGTQITDLAWTNQTARVTTTGPAGKPEAYFPPRVIGNDPLRQFLVPFPGGRLQVLEAAYDPRTNQWFDVYGDEDRLPGEWGHWTGRGMNWNYMCASCHNTRLWRNYDEPSDAYATTMAEMSVGCEACHGPLKAHNAWQKRFGKTSQTDPTLPKLTRAQTLDNCGACHARRTDLTGDFNPGDRFLDNFELVLVDRSETYYADGQVRGEDYEYGSFLGSRMHQRGAHCLDCHNPHSMKTLLPGNWLCLRCHGGSDTNAPLIDPVAHSHHKVYGFSASATPGPTNIDLAAYRPGTIREQGGECVNCHMPQTVYMQRHWRHDHGFTIPDPLLTKQFGIPNACNRCHQDKSADWALSFCDQWYGPKMERPTRRRAQAIARAQRGDASAPEELAGAVRLEPSPYWQAVELGLLGAWAARPEMSSLFVANLSATNALVRASAAAALAAAVSDANPGAEEALKRALQDPVRSVRLAAASSLGSKLDLTSAAGQEFQRYLEVNADEPSGQVQLGISCSLHHDLDSALRHFQKAVEWDPHSPPFRHELAVTFSALGRPQDALRVLQDGSRLSPRDAQSHYDLGLAYNELSDVRGAATELHLAVGLDPRHALAWYNLGLAQNALGQTEEAIESLLRAQSVDPDDARSPYARATILARLGRTGEARTAVQQSLTRDPSSAEAKQLLELLSQ